MSDTCRARHSDYEGRRAASEIGRLRLYRVDPSDGSVSVAADDFVQPNGLALSADERTSMTARPTSGCSTSTRAC